MAYKDNLVKVIVEFLRCNFTDPRGRLTSFTFTFTGTGSAQTINFSDNLTNTSNSVYCVYSVTGSTALKKWRNYDLDLQNQNITGTFTNGTIYTVIVGIGTTCWIYEENPDIRLGTQNYPRISAKISSNNGNRLGRYDSDMEVITTYAIDFWTTKKYVYTDTDGIKHSGADLANYLQRIFINYFQTSVDDLYPLLFNFKIIGGRGAAFEPVKEVFRSITTIEMKHIIGC